MILLLGNNLLVLALNHTEHTDHTQISSTMKLFFRLLASLPSFILAYCISDNIGMITDFTGICGFFLAFIFPPLVAEYSERYFKDRGWNSTTIYSIPWLTSKFSRGFIFLFGIVIIVYTLTITIYQHFN